MEITMDIKVQLPDTLEDLNPGELFRFIEDEKESDPETVYMRGNLYPTANEIYCMQLINGDVFAYNKHSEVLRLYGKLKVSDVEYTVRSTNE